LLSVLLASPGDFRARSQVMESWHVDPNILLHVPPPLAICEKAAMEASTHE